MRIIRDRESQDHRSASLDRLYGNRLRIMRGRRTIPTLTRFPRKYKLQSKHFEARNDLHQINLLR